MQEENQVHLFNDLEFDSTARQHIMSITSWAMVIVIVAVIGYLLNIIQLFSAPKVVVRSEGFETTTSISGTDTTSAILGIFVGLLINYFLFRFASLAKSGINSLNQADLNKSFNSLKIYFIITTIILILVFVIVLLAAIMVVMRVA